MSKYRSALQLMSSSSRRLSGEESAVLAPGITIKVIGGGIRGFGVDVSKGLGFRVGMGSGSRGFWVWGSYEGLGFRVCMGSGFKGLW